MTIFIFLSFYLFLYFFTRGFFTVINLINTKREKNKIELEESNIFYPLFALFFIGNLVFVLNFIFSLNYVFIFLLILIITISFFNLKNLKKLSLSFTSIFQHVFLPLILSVSTFGTNLHADAGGYHLNSQLWIKEYPIVFGLSNLDPTYGYLSIFEYVSSFFWIQGNFIFLHFINLIFVVLFFNFLFSNLIVKKSNFLFFTSLFIFLFGIIDNFGYSGGKNGFIVLQSAGKFDNSFSILFIITNLLIFNAIKNKEYSSNNFNKLIFLSFFTFQIKLFGVYLFVPLVYFILSSKEPLMTYLKSIKVYIGLFSFWTLKSLITNSCLIYPVAPTCIKNLKWYTDGYVEGVVSIVRNFHFSYSFNQSIITWFNEWRYLAENNTTILNFFFSYFFLFLVSKIFFKTDSLVKEPIFTIFIFSYILLLFLAWLTTSPEIRFGIGIFVLSVSLLTIFIDDYRFSFLKFFENKSSFILLTFLCAFLIVRLSSYKEFLDNPFLIYEIKTPVVEYIDSKDSWNKISKVKVTECWANIDCVPNNSVTKKSKIYQRYLLFTK